MRISVGSDHAGFALKAHLTAFLRDAGHEVADLGPATDAPVDYPDYADSVARSVAAGSADLGLLVCGTGIGMAIAANKVRGIRAAVAFNEYMAQMAREHNDANVLCLGGRVIGAGLAESIVARFVASAFRSGRHAARVEKIAAVESRHA